MSGENNRNQYVLPHNQPVVSLDVSGPFTHLSNSEKFYAYYLSQAAWTGGLITLLQTSPESGAIFVLLHKLFSAQSPNKFQAAALAYGFTEADVNALFVYTAGIFSNAGNYKGFGDTKFVPGIDSSRLEQMLKLSPIWSELQAVWYWFNLKERIYDLTEGKTCLGFPPHGCTTYFSRNCDTADSDRVKKWMKMHKLEAYNTRCFKIENNSGLVEYEIRVASEECGDLACGEEGRYTFKLVKGDYAPILSKTISALEHALPYANQIEALMLQNYMKSFKSGSIRDHKKGSKLWVQNKSPPIETYIGFIETYRDPAGIRGEFEGFVAVVNHTMSEKFGVLVSNAEKLLARLPWPKTFEKDNFLRPDFTSLDVITFAGSGIPAGINIPNYDDIRQTIGFKNVSLGNVIPASYHFSSTPFLSSADTKLLKQWRVSAFELQVGLHELLGHGSGKLFCKEVDGTCNFPNSLVNPITGEPIYSCYQHGDTFDLKFGSMSSPYEECRAEAVGLYLSLDPDVLRIFGHKGSKGEDVTYVNWLSLVWAGAGRALEMWEPGRGWLQAHAQARYVLTKILIQAGVVKVTQVGKDDLRITLLRDSLHGAGRNAISNFLLQLQVYKSTGDLEAAQNLFLNLSEVGEPWLSWRSIILAHKQPRNMLIQPNIINMHGNLILRTYESSIEGLIHSWIERFAEPEPLYSSLIQLARADLQHFI